MAKLVNIVDHFDDSPSASDQEELVDATDFDEDLTDVDDLAYSNYCHTNERIGTASDSGLGSASEQIPGCTNSDLRTSKCRFFNSIVTLFLAAFMLLVVFPFYVEQLAVENRKNNAYGAILYLSSVVTVIFLLLASSASYIKKWNIKLYKCPIPWKR